MHRPDGPLFAVEANDVTVFADVASTTAYLEPPDVQDGVFRLFDRNGLEYGLGVEAGTVVVGGPIGEAPNYLAGHLRSYLKQVPRKRRAHNDSEIDDMRLTQLVDEFRSVERI